MLTKKITHPISFYTTGGMSQAIKDISDQLGISMSDFIRRAVEDYFVKTGFNLKGNQSGEDNQEEGHELL
jgi:hypothetical protein